MADTKSVETEATELLCTLIRNACVNDGTPESGHEDRNADALEAYFAGSGLNFERHTAGPGRVSLLTRIEGSDPKAPTLLLMGHTDVVPVNPSGWERDPFAAEVVAWCPSIRQAGSAIRSWPRSWTAWCGDAARPTCSTSRPPWRWPRAGWPRAASSLGGR